MSSLPETNLEALNLACTRRKYAAMEVEDILSFVSDKLVCSLQEVHQASVIVKGSMIIQKKSPYLGIFKHT
jgi:hypothetical protein